MLISLLCRRRREGQVATKVGFYPGCDQLISGVVFDAAPQTDERLLLGALALSFAVALDFAADTPRCSA